MASTKSTDVGARRPAATLSRAAGRGASTPARSRSPLILEKCPTGIRGVDQITKGGLPRGRPILICGDSGTGKTLFGVEFLVRGAIEHGEPGVFVSFEERATDLAKNSASLGFDLEALIARKKLVIDRVAVDRTNVLESGEYNLEGLFLRLGAAIDSIKAKRVVLDTIEVLFAVLTNLGVLRSELHRLFEWLKDRGVTTIVTGERGDGHFTRFGLEEYVSDCVILLDQRVVDQIATRRLRIVKYRGSTHGTNEYPFLIDEQGFYVLPITGIGLTGPAPRSRVSTGIAALDAMLGGKGYYRGSTIMASGASGTGKSSMAAHFVDAACRRGERCLYFAFEESPDQIERNMSSVGLGLKKWVERGTLRFFSARPATFGLEAHISMMIKRIEELRPSIVVIDPVSAFEAAGTLLDARLMVMRMIDMLKSRGITALFTALTAAEDNAEQTAVGVSSLIDSWILLRNLEQSGERTRALFILKSRGMKHSNQVRELILTDRGMELAEIAVGPNGILVGSARQAQVVQDRVATVASRQEIQRRQNELTRKKKTLKAKIAELESEYSAEIHDIEQAIMQARARSAAAATDRTALAAERLRTSAGPRRRNGASK